MLYHFDGKTPSVGAGSYVSDLARVIGDVVIGDNCYIGHGAIIRGDYGRIEIGDGTAVEEGVIIHAPPGDLYVIGKMVTLGHGAILHGTCIGDSSVVGMGAILSLFSEVGEWTIIGEGSLVRSKQKIASRIVAAGNPIRVIREISEKDQEFWEYGKRLYVDLAEKYLKLGMHEVKL